LIVWSVIITTLLLLLLPFFDSTTVDTFFTGFVILGTMVVGIGKFLILVILSGVVSVTTAYEVLERSVLSCLRRQGVEGFFATN
jgi:hypothetical protein